MNDFIKENYHTHTWRCQHADGTERQYIEAAIKNGIKILGFADHVPCPFKDGYVSRIRMTMDQAPDYVETLRKLGEEYKNGIEIQVGFETEYIPEFFEEQKQLVKDLGCDYMIMGQHFIAPENHSPYVGRATSDDRLLKTYVDMVLEGAATGSFRYVAHPDLIHYEGDTNIYNAEMRRMCEGLKKINIPVEINVLGLITERHYPDERFWKIVGETGNQAIIGMDAHAVNELTNKMGYRYAQALAEKYHVIVLN